MNDEQRPDGDEPADAGKQPRKIPRPWLPKLPDFQAQQREMIRAAASRVKRTR